MTAKLEKSFLEKFKGWHERLSKDFSHAPSYIYPEVMKVLKEMEEEIKNNDL